MTDQEIPDSEEQQEVELAIPEDKPSKMVPLEALEAERRKRQDLEAHNRAMQDMMLQKRAPEPVEEDDEDDEEFITKAELKRRIKDATFGNKREVLEESFCTSNPQAIELITTHLENIIKRKPWLAQTIESAPNRYARAYEIVQDYMPREIKETTSAGRFSTPQADAKRIVENAQKPGSPATIAKVSNSSNADYLRSIAGKPEFREYRRKMLGK